MPPPRGEFRRRIGRFARALLFLALGLVLFTIGAIILGTRKVIIEHAPPQLITNDVTGLNPVALSHVIEPTTTEEVVAAIRNTQGPIAIGGGRYSMGGQTAVDGGVQVDMRKMNRILSIDTAARQITVQAGTRWRQIQEAIDTLGLAVKIMQTYSNFTVGGSMSVNSHGRYVGQGPLVLSVRSFRMVLADGSVVEARGERPEARELLSESNAGCPRPLVSCLSPLALFYATIGSYGALGVITDATLDLVPNTRVKRQNSVMPITEYARWFADSIRPNKLATFHNGDIYPDAYETVNAVTYWETGDSITVADRLIPKDRNYGLNRFIFHMISEWPGGKWTRQHVVDPWIFRGQPVTWRNYEASYDVAELEPSSRAKKTYVLQEYFVPVEQFDAFVPKMRAVLNKHDVNVINISIRHALADPGTFLAWAPSETFAFVIYYKQETSEPAYSQVGVWTRELIDSVLTVGGRWYLPYQPHATLEQFARGYPGKDRLFALKRQLDPDNRFRNHLWDTYYLPTIDSSAIPLEPSARAMLDTLTGYRRDEGQTFLTHPEWYIVYNPDEYAEWMKDKLPTDFPYLESIGQFWANYSEAKRLTANRYPFNWGYHVMLGVIGTSYTAELALKGLYENTVGRFSGWTAGHQLTDEDHFAAQVAADYGKFIHVRPWYEFRFAEKLKALWTDLPLWGPHAFRKWERKFFLSVEYGVKAIYGTVIEKATRAAYTPEQDRMYLVTRGMVPGATALDPRHGLMALPRYDKFRDTLLAWSARDTFPDIQEIAGNDRIFLTGVAPASWNWQGARGWGVNAMPLPTDPSRKRITVSVPVSDLLPTLRDLSQNGIVVDHVYDY